MCFVSIGRRYKENDVSVQGKSLRSGVESRSQSKVILTGMGGVRTA